MGTGRQHTQLSAHQNERIVHPDGYKSRVRQMWGKRAPSYDIRNDFHPPLCEQLVALADLRPGGTRVLDVASGTGSVALSAAQVLGPECIITALDVSDAMLAKARLPDAYRVA